MGWLQRALVDLEALEKVNRTEAVLAALAVLCFALPALAESGWYRARVARSGGRATGPLFWPLVLVLAGFAACLADLGAGVFLDWRTATRHLAAAGTAAVAMIALSCARAATSRWFTSTAARRCGFGFVILAILAHLWAAGIVKTQLWCLQDQLDMLRNVASETTPARAPSPVSKASSAIVWTCSAATGRSRLAEAVQSADSSCLPSAVRMARDSSSAL